MTPVKPCARFQRGGTINTPCLSPPPDLTAATCCRASPIHSGTPQGSSAASTDMAQQPSPGKSKAQSAFIPVQLDSGRLGLQGGPTLVRNVPSHVRETQPPSSSQEGSTAASQPEGALLGVSCQGGNTSYANIYLGEVCSTAVVCPLYLPYLLYFT